MGIRSEVDVLIIGAGLAGLTAALELKKANRSFVVLEARVRPGGRIYSILTEENIPIDFGAQWISPKHHRMKRLLSEFGLHTIPTYQKGNSIYELNRNISYQKIAPVKSVGLIDINQFSEKLNKISSKLISDAPWEGTLAHQYDQITMKQLLEKNMYTNLGKRYLTLLIEEMLCAKLHEVSALDVLWCFKTAGSTKNIRKSEKLWIEEGAGALVKAISDSLVGNIKYNYPVKKITYNENGAMIHSDKASLSAKRVIIAIAPNLQTRIEFEPSLPATKVQLNERSGLGSVIKFIVVYPKPFWRARGLNGMAYSECSVIKQTFDSSPKNEQLGVLTVLTSGSSARHLENLSIEVRKKEVLAALFLLFGVEATNPLQFFEKNWTEDEWTQGGYGVHYAPGVITNFGHALFEPVASLHWAGSETATEWRLFMEGAVQSGERVAKEVLAALK